MKIRVNREKHLINKNKIKRGFKKRIVLPRFIRLIIIGIISLFLLYSAFNVYASYQKQETTTKSTTVFSYYQNGFFDYKVYLNNNSIYQDKEFLLPGEGIYFTNIIKNITTSFTYSLNIDTNAEISGSYNLAAEIQTSLWSKNYSIDTKNSNGTFKSNGKKVEFTIDFFDVDLDYYENIVSKIEGETGVTVSSPNLIIKCSINVIIKTPSKTIYKTFTPSLSYTLKTKQIEITENAANYQSNMETEKQTQYHKEVVDERNRWSLVSILLLVILIIILIITRSNLKISQIEKNVKKINKKYGEWLVEITNNPVDSSKKMITLKSFDDLTKTGEELGKPILHYHESFNSHLFYVMDGSTVFVYELSLMIKH